MPRITVLIAIIAVIATASPTFSANCSQTFVGLVPLTDLGTGTYQGFAGGLYPGGQNAPPTSHMSSLLTVASAIVPLNAAGIPDPVNGKIGFTSMGMSNTEIHSQSFASLVQNPVAAGLNPALVYFTGAVGGKPASSWADSNDSVWSTLDQRVINAGLTNLQVQVIWVLQAEPAPAMQPFPAGAQDLKDNLIAALQILRRRFPNMRLAYFTCRIYAGYASSNLNPESIAYENGFSVKWLIEQQIDGDPALAHDGPTPLVPTLSWGPYLWADGLGPDGVEGGAPGRSDGLEWLCSDLADDGTHPSSQGADKVAGFFFDWFSTDASSQGWFLSLPSSVGGHRAPPAALLIGPNPTRAFARIRMPSDRGRVYVRVYDVAGRVVLRGDFTGGEGSLDLRAVPTGTYFIRVRDGNNLPVGQARVTVVH